MEIAIVLFIMIVLIALAAGIFIGVRYLSQPGKPTGPYVQADIEGKTFNIPLRRDRELSIGREPGNHIVVNNHLVSRRHARIVADGTRWLLIDNDSSNGTFVNNRPVLRCPINPDDDVEIGPMRLRLVLPGPSGAAATPGGGQSGTTARSSVAAAAPNGVAPPGPVTSDSTSTSQQMFGPFAVVRNLGEGGVGKVLLAQDTRNNGRLVALKLLSHDNDFLIEKFRQEGTLKLTHPHIATILETSAAAGRSYIAMEYVDGANLRKLLTNQPIPVNTALIIIGQVLSALNYAHQHQVIHRDIKPENIMIAPGHGVKIIDFGIAKILSTVTRTRDGLIMGTPYYMSYEQAMGIPVNPTSDLYATAIVLYEMLTTKVPFSGNHPTEVLRHHQQALPMPPVQLNPDIPPHVNDAILRALEKDASRRFANAQEFITALGCPLNTPLPADFDRLAAQYILPVYNERSNAVDLPTRDVAPSMPVNNHTHVLRVKSGARKGQYITLNRVQSIGRSDIDPSDGTISRQHVRIENQGNGGCVLYDTSRHGTVVNGMSLPQGGCCHLEPGAFIQVGQTVLVYEVS